MTDDGWVKIHRKIWENPWMRNLNYLAVWVWLLTHAEYRDEGAGSVIWEGKRYVLKKGELSCGLYQISEDTGVSKSSVERALKVFSDEGQIEKRAGNKFTLVLVKNWERYQSTRETDGKQMGNERESSGNILKNIRNKEIKNTNIAAVPAAETVSVFEVFKVLAEPSYGNITQRKSIEELIKIYGIEKTLAAAKYAVSVQADKYAPIITNPYQLKSKFGELVAYKARTEKQQPNLVAEI